MEVTTRSFVGRVDELAALDAALEAATAGQATTVLIGGDAGVGKTRLLTTWNERARAAGARVATGVALDLGEHGPPYLPITGALRELLAGLEPDEIDAVLGADRSTMARVIPELSLEAAVEPGGRPAPLGQARLFDR